MRTDADGIKLWDQSYGGHDSEHLETLIETTDGGFIMGGATWWESAGGNKTSTNHGFADFWVVRTTAGGNPLWDQTFGGEGYDYLQSVQQTADGGFVLAGTSSSGTNETKSARPLGFDDGWVVRLDADGNRLWDRTYGGFWNDNATVIRELPDGGFLIGGSSQGFGGTNAGFGELDYWIVRVDRAGTRLWQRLYGGSARDQLLTMALTGDGGCIVGGWSWSGVDGNKTSEYYGYTDYWVLRLDANGNKVWERSYGGIDSEGLNSIVAMPGGFLLAGYSSSGLSSSKTTLPLGEFDFWIIRIDENGQDIWQKALGGPNSDVCRAAALTSDGGFILAGSSTSLAGDRHGRGFGGDDYWLVKLTPEAGGLRS